VTPVRAVRQSGAGLPLRHSLTQLHECYNFDQALSRELRAQTRLAVRDANA